MLGGFGVDVDLVSPSVFVWGRCKTKGGGQSDREQDRFGSGKALVRSGLGEGSWVWSVSRLIDVWPQRTRVRENR